MSESERRQRISSAPRLTPEEVATRAFPTAFRGVAETDVRAFLNRVSEEMTAGRLREQELASIIDDQETRLRTPPPLDEAQLLEMLGEETTRLLRSAREAAADIREKADERATRIVQEANEESKRLRQQAEEVLGRKTGEADAIAQALLEEAEQRATDLMRVADERSIEVHDSADRYADDLRARVEHESSMELNEARARGIELVEEATALRERVIDDLARRRELLTGQLEELRTGRDRLLDAYRVVKRTFLDATEALAQVEARATTGRAMTGPDPADLADALAAETDAARASGLARDATGETPPAPDSVAEAAADVTAEVAADASTGEPEEETAAPVAAAPEVEAPAPDTPPAADEPTTEETEAVSIADVDDLFARLRAGAHPPVETNGGTATAPSAVATDGAGDSPAEAPGAATAPGAGAAGSDDVPDWTTPRDLALAPLRVALVRQIKLAVGNEQNEVLDKIRRQKGRPAAATVLPAVDAQVAAWTTVVATAASDAYRAASVDSGADGATVTVPDDLATALARAMVEPLRDRLVAAIETAHEPGETSAQVAERIGARYREWKNRSAEASGDDVLVAAYSRGRYDAAGEGAQLTWRTPDAGCCPDCADNALEPTAKGEPFPTGQQHPPAHPGCRCGLTTAPATVDLAVAEAESTV